MKKIIIFLVVLGLAITAAADVQKTHQSLEMVTNEPYRDWYLKTEKKIILKANSFERIYYKIISFFSSFHKKDLQKALIFCLEEIQKESLNTLQNEQKITLEKIKSLLDHEKEGFWFSPIKTFSSPDLSPKWTFQKIKESKLGFKLPCQKNGCFFNDNYEVMMDLSMQEVWPFLRSIFKAKSKIDLNQLIQKDKVLPRSDKLNIQWLGHSSFLVQIENINILIDPVTEAFHPLLGGKFYCFKRYIKPGIELKDLPKIDVILISHNHFDHLEDKAILFLKKYQPEILVPQGLKKYFESKGLQKVEEYMWWEHSLASSVEKKVNFYAVPARHNSMDRGNIEKQKSLWCGWVIETKDKQIYFAGDTAFDEEIFQQIQQKFKSIDIALLPIAPDKIWERHLDYLQALKAFEVLQAKIMIPMHWGAYRTGDEKIEDPYLKMLEIKRKNAKLNEKIKVLKVGQRYQDS